MAEKKSSYEKLKTVTIGDIIDKFRKTLTMPQQNYQQTSRRRQFIYKGIFLGGVTLIICRFFLFGAVINPWVESLKLTLLLGIPVLIYYLINRLIDSQDGQTKELVQEATGREFYQLLTLFNQKKSKLEGVKLAEEVSLFVQTSDDLPILAETAMDQGALTEIKRQIREKLNENQPAIESWFGEHNQVLSPFFSNFQEIIRLLNHRWERGQLATYEYHRYIAILRSQLSEDESYLILIYSLFSLKGVGIGIDLSYTSFFGSEGEIKDNRYLNLPAVIKDITITHFVAHTDELVSKTHRQEMREAYQTSRGLQQNYLKRTSY